MSEKKKSIKEIREEKEAAALKKNLDKRKKQIADKKEKKE